MFLSRWITSTLLLAAEFTLTSTHPLIDVSSLRQDDSYDARTKRSSEHPQKGLEVRAPDQTDDGGNLNLNSSDAQSNVSTADACNAALSSMSSVANPAGFAACYNILDWHKNTGMFQADLKLFQITAATGQFADIPMNNITLLLDFPPSTQFQILMNSKRDLSDLERRQNAMTEIQQYSLMGNFKMQLDLTKLNDTEIVSLMVPQVIFQAKTSDNIILSVNMPSTDAVYFVAGQFKDQSSPQIIAQVTDPKMATFAIDSSKGFILPGTTFGIFPTGLVITSTWCVLFILAFGLGTIGRIQHRNAYRRRVALERARMDRKI